MPTKTKVYHSKMSYCPEAIIARASSMMSAADNICSRLTYAIECQGRPYQGLIRSAGKLNPDFYYVVIGDSYIPKFGSEPVELIDCKLLVELSGEDSHGNLYWLSPNKTNEKLRQGDIFQVYDSGDKFQEHRIFGYEIYKPKRQVTF